MFVYSHMARVLVGLFTLVPHPLVQSLAISFMNGIVWQVSQYAYSCLSFNAHTHMHTHIHMHPCMHTHTHTHQL